jgi:hypothetical protein
MNGVNSVLDRFWHYFCDPKPLKKSLTPTKHPIIEFKSHRETFVWSENPFEDFPAACRSTWLSPPSSPSTRTFWESFTLQFYSWKLLSSTFLPLESKLHAELAKSVCCNRTNVVINRAYRALLSSPKKSRKSRASKVCDLSRSRASHLFT